MACGSVAAPGRPAPHEVMRFTLAREELREDRTEEGRVVELDREIGEVVLGGFRPGGADFGFADKDAVARRVAAGIVIGDDANLVCLHRTGDDIALIFADRESTRLNSSHQ